MRKLTALTTFSFLLAVCFVSFSAQAGNINGRETAVLSKTGIYVFESDKSTVVQTGGIAGVHRTYVIEGRLLLSVDPNAGTASFVKVDANAIDDSQYKRTLDPNEVFNITGLVGIVIDDVMIVFTGKASEGSDVLIIAILNDDLMYLVGQTFPPAGSADFFIFSLAAVTQRKYGGGTGEPNDPYLIYTAEQMNAIGAKPNDWDKHFKLMADIDLIGTGNNVGSLVGCLWDIETSGLTTSSTGQGKTTAEMQTAGTLLKAGWDFVNETKNGTEDIWWILEGQDYPRLYWELIDDD